MRGIKRLCSSTTKVGDYSPHPLRAVIPVTAVVVRLDVTLSVRSENSGIAARKRSTLMRVTRTRGFALLTIAFLWAITPAMACVLPGATMTPAERECCHHMAEQCGSSMMPASHSCCKAQGPTNTVLPQAPAVGSLRPLTIAVIPPVASLATLPAVTVRCHLSFLHAPPPEPSPGSNSVLRI